MCSHRDASRKKLEEAFEGISRTQFGKLLSHRYTQGGLVVEDNLKGLDQVIWDALSKKTGWMGSLLPVVFQFNSFFLSAAEREKVRREREVFAFSEEDLNCLVSLKRRPRKHPWRERKRILSPNNRHGVKAPIPFLVVSRGDILDYDSKVAGEYIGNEADPSTIKANYYHAALIVHKPRRGRICSLFRICKAVLTWHPEMKAAIPHLPKRIVERLKVGGKWRKARKEEGRHEGMTSHLEKGGL